MKALFRILVVGSVLLSSGVLQVAAAAGEDPCCAGEGPAGDEGGAGGDDAGCPDCPPGLACACCAFRGPVAALAVDVAPAVSRGVAVAVVVSEPRPGGLPPDIFHPPRA